MAGSSVLPVLPLPSPVLVGDRMRDTAASSMLCLGCSACNTALRAGLGSRTRSRALLKRAADGRAGSCPAPTGSRWAGQADAPGFAHLSCLLGVGARGADAAQWSSWVPAGDLFCSSASDEVEAEGSGCTSGKHRTCTKVKCVFPVAWCRAAALV